MRRAILAPAVVGMLVLGAGAGHAAPGGHKADPLCSITPSSAAVGQIYVVGASGLPTGTAINLWVTDPSGATTGSPLGSTPDGTFGMNESSASAGLWTYAFSGPVKQHTDVYASCSVAAS